MKGEIIYMNEKPLINTPIGENYIDFLKENYHPTKAKSGESYDSTLTYITLERTFFSNQKILNMIIEEGLDVIGFLMMLRIYMSNGIGYGIPLYDKSLQKVLNAISIDTDIPLAQLEQYYEVLKEYGILFIINDHDGNEVITERTQLFNYELKEYTRQQNAERKRIWRANKKKEKAEAEIAEEEMDEFTEDETYSEESNTGKLEQSISQEGESLFQILSIDPDLSSESSSDDPFCW